MYFIPQHAKLYAFIAHIKPFYRYLLTGLAAALLLYGWYALLYRTVKNSIAFYQQEQQFINEQYHTCNTAEKSCKTLRADIRALKRELQPVYGTQTDLHTGITQLLHAATNAHMTFSGYTIEKEVNDETRKKSTISLTVIGTYEQYLSFLQQLNASSLVLAFHSIILTQKDELLFSINNNVTLYHS